jgi:formylglycine-generating enzyme required for sulfatase activity
MKEYIIKTIGCIAVAFAFVGCAHTPNTAVQKDRQQPVAISIAHDGPRPGEPWENSLGMKFVPVPGTNVLFCIWETRVQDFEAFVKATSYDAGEGWRVPGDIGASGRSYVAGFSQTPLHPVTHVNWDDAEAFCRWLTEKERAAGNPSAGQEFRLPTDAEWSQAVGLSAESGVTPEDKDRMKREDVYPWGAGFPPPKGSGNYSGEGDGWSGKIDGYTDGAKFTAKVGSYTANRFGIYDLGGNVWEWCSDWFNAERKERVIRGASFVQGAPGVLLSSHHSRKPPGTRDFNFGFRCVVTVGAPSP